MSLGKRLSKDKDLKEKYISSIQDALEKGYAEKVVIPMANQRMAVSGISHIIQ